MRLLAAFILTLAALPAMASDELLLNHDFADGITHWRLNRSPDYGYVTGAEVKDGVLHLTELKGMKPYYMNLVQPVEIEQGKSYRLTFEYKGRREAGSATASATTSPACSQQKGPSFPPPAGRR